MKTLALLLGLASVVLAGDVRVQFVMTGLNTHVGHRLVSSATRITIYDDEPGVTGYRVEITVCHPSEHGCILRRETEYASVDGSFGMASVVFEVPMAEIDGEPEITALPSDQGF
jgi:hypothetical protein